MTTAKLHDPDALVSGDWLAAHLDDPDLRIFDCTTYLELDQGKHAPYRVVSGRADYAAGHIPGAGYLDLQADFSVPESPFRFTLPAPETAAVAFARHGIGDDTRVVLYSRKTSTWATRLWWMLRWLGFDRAAILDGGFDAWVADGHAVSTEPCQYRAAALSATPRPRLFAGRDDVLAAIGDPDVLTMNALNRDLHAGQDPRYGRPGRIPGSCNIPAPELLDPDTRKLRPIADIAAAFAGVGAGVGADPDKRVITYCGGGINATLNAYLLHQLGHTDIAVYDNSMSEWANDPDLPMETG